MPEDDIYVLKLHLKQLYKDIEKIDYELKDLHPKATFQVLQFLEDIISRVFIKKKSEREKNLEDSRIEILQEIEITKKRIELLEKGI